MPLRIGDSVFLQDGRPGVMVSTDAKNDSVKVDSDRGVVRNATRNGYINGLKPEERQSFEAILDSVKEIKDPAQRIEELRSRIEELSLDPKNTVLSRYLTAEMAHIMNMAGVKPRVFEIDSFKLR